MAERIWAGAFDMNDGAINELAHQQPPFAQFLGMKITHVSPQRVTAELVAREELNNRFGLLHGGAIMALADNLGGTATTANLKAGQSTTCLLYTSPSPETRHDLVCRLLLEKKKTDT